MGNLLYYFPIDQLKGMVSTYGMPKKKSYLMILPCLVSSSLILRTSHTKNVNKLRVPKLDVNKNL
jgi:hypothetical protein